MINDELNRLNEELRKLKTAIENMKLLETSLSADQFNTSMAPLYSKREILEKNIAELEGPGAIAQGNDTMAVGSKGIAVNGDSLGMNITGDSKVGGVHAESLKAKNAIAGNQINIKNVFSEKKESNDPDNHLRNAYLNKVKNDTGILPLEGIDPKAMDNTLSLSSIYTALMTSGSSHETSEDLSCSKGIERVSALEHLIFLNS